MMIDVFSVVENLIAAEALMDQYKGEIILLLYLSFGVYKRYIKHKYKRYTMSCDCDPNNVFDQMRNYRNAPEQCIARISCISNALFELVKSMNKASESIYIVMPELTMPQLMECILSAHSRLVNIKIILNHSEGLENRPDIKKLLDEGKNWNCPE